MGSGIPRTLDGLPNELKLLVLQNCEPSQMKALKSQNRSWANAATPVLFERLYFVPLPRTLAYFEQVTQNPNLAPHVKHLIFHDSQLAKSLLKRADCIAALPAGYSAEQKLEAWIAYCRVYYQQKFLLTTEADLRSLLRGLPNLTELEKVTIVGGPSRLLGSRWYFTNAPHAWDFQGTGLSSSVWSLRTPAGRHAWDGRAVHNLFRALNATRTRPINRHIGNWDEQTNTLPLKMGLPLFTLNPPEPSTSTLLSAWATRVFCHLTSLNLQIDKTPRFIGHQYYDADVRSLTRLLVSARSLKKVSVGFTQNNLQVSDTTLLFNAFHRTNLEIARFRGLTLQPADLLGFLGTHATRLTDFRLEKVGFMFAATHRWAGVVQQSQALQNMAFVDLDVYEWRVNVQGQVVKVGRRWRREGGVGAWV